MPHTLFIADLHLTTERPAINQQFFEFIEKIVPAAEALYILGDLFEYWVGDDDSDNPLNQSVAATLAKLAQHHAGGTKVFSCTAIAIFCSAKTLPSAPMRN